MLSSIKFALLKSISQITYLTFSSFIFYRKNVFYLTLKFISLMVFGPLAIVIWLLYIPVVFLLTVFSAPNIYYGILRRQGEYDPNFFTVHLILISSLISIPFFILNFIFMLIMNINLFLLNWMNWDESRSYANEIGMD